MDDLQDLSRLFPVPPVLGGEEEEHLQLVAFSSIEPPVVPGLLVVGGARETKIQYFNNMHVCMYMYTILLIYLY